MQYSISLAVAYSVLKRISSTNPIGRSNRSVQILNFDHLKALEHNSQYIAVFSFILTNLNSSNQNVFGLLSQLPIHRYYFFDAVLQRITFSQYLREHGVSPSTKSLVNLRLKAFLMLFGRGRDNKARVHAGEPYLSLPAVEGGAEKLLLQFVSILTSDKYLQTSGFFMNQPPSTTRRQRFSHSITIR
jgi:hypothetical protein